MRRKESIKKEWNDAAESWTDFVRQGKDYYRDELNNPATFRLIGNVRGQFVLDLACGEGYNTRILARKGAKVTGVDFSEKMINLARQQESKEKLGITYYVSDAANMKQLSSKHFNLVTCFMALHDIEHYEDAISEVARVLKKNSKFIFSILHPCFEWGIDIEVKRYFQTIDYEVPWNMKRLIKPFKTTSFHRTLTNYFQTLHENGFLVSRLVEPRPTSRIVSKCPRLKKILRIPLFIIIEALKK